MSHIARIPPADLQFSFVRGAGPGGQNVNKVATAAQLRFDRCRVPADHLIGEENAGFRAIMENFNGERLMMSAGAWTSSISTPAPAIGNASFGRGWMKQMS